MDALQARRLRRPSWVNLRAALGLLLFCGALLAGQRVLEGAKTTVLVWAATRDLAQDTPLTPADVAPAEVRLPGHVATRYASATKDLDGVVLLRPLAAGELIPIAWLADGPSAEAGRSITIPTTPEHAVGGDLSPGDRVDVYGTFNSGDARARTSLLVRAVEVVDVTRAGGLVVGEEAIVGVTVAVTPVEAARLAFAIRTAEIDIAKVVGPGTAAGPTTITAGHLP